MKWRSARQARAGDVEGTEDYDQYNLTKLKSTPASRGPRKLCLSCLYAQVPVVHARACAGILLSGHLDPPGHPKRFANRQKTTPSLQVRNLSSLGAEGDCALRPALTSIRDVIFRETPCQRVPCKLDVKWYRSSTTGKHGTLLEQALDSSEVLTPRFQANTGVYDPHP